ncbi:hypothetical protein VB264_18560 [Arcicella aquatica]|uniref:DUF3300 domain-containing protein n=1 Tax=Arcicella aquatica TaxID=217141 RepID=A0ABU5QTY1_9BACT|nr:hypothetical protein [Arcicella aquatica]MEA5259806.1 hypothetical protein [Arcicella aquatica]
MIRYTQALEKGSQFQFKANILITEEMKTNMIVEGIATKRITKINGVLSTILLMTTLLFVNINAFSQTNQLETDKGLQNSIASYNADVRQAILLVSQYPQTLTQLQQEKNQTQGAFQALISDFSQKKQGWFYELTRFPELTHTLATLPSGQSKDDINKLLPNNDENLQTAAWRLYRHHHDDLVQADNLNQQAQNSFAKAIQPLDVPTQDAFKKLVQYPDVLLLLTDNIDLTTKLGQQYVADKDGLTTQLASWHDSLMIQNQTQMATYKKELGNNPQAQQELNQAAKDFAKTNGYILPNGQIAYGNNYNYGYANPYSYWFGYPYWYGSPLWYPSAYWGSFGLSYGFGGFGFSAFPTYGFSNWFYNGGYYMNYPYLYNHFGNYYRSVAINHPRYNNGMMAGSRNNYFRSYNGNNGGYNRGGVSYRPDYGGNGGFQNRGFSGGGMRSFGGGGGGRRR